MNPVKELLENIEKSIAENDYRTIKIRTTSYDIQVSIDDLTYTSRYFIKVDSAGNEMLININNVEAVELQ